MSLKQTGNKIRELREQRGLSLTELARQSGISRGYLHLIEKGESSPTQEKLAAIAEALGVLMAELLGEIETFDELSNIPESLRRFAQEHNLALSDVIMLSKINYRGRRPESTLEWKVLYNVIKGTLGED